MQVIHAYKTEATIEGMVKTVLISIEVEHEETVDFSYWDKKEAKRTQADLDRGSIGCYFVKVTARFSDLSQYEGQDSLGQVFARSSDWIKDLEQTVNDHDMVKNAIDDLITNVLNGKSQIDTFLTKAA